MAIVCVYLVKERDRALCHQNTAPSEHEQATLSMPTVGLIGSDA